MQKWNLDVCSFQNDFPKHKYLNLEHSFKLENIFRTRSRSNCMLQSSEAIEEIAMSSLCFYVHYLSERWVTVLALGELKSWTHQLFEVAESRKDVSNARNHFANYTCRRKHFVFIEFIELQKHNDINDVWRSEVV